MDQIKVAAETLNKVAGLTQSITHALRKDGVCQVCAIGKDANFATVKALASLHKLIDHSVVKWTEAAMEDRLDVAEFAEWRVVTYTVSLQPPHTAPSTSLR